MSLGFAMARTVFLDARRGIAFSVTAAKVARVSAAEPALAD
jgi:hypothetical protein